MRRRRRDEGAPEQGAAIEIPHDPVNEQVVLAAVLVDPAARKSLAQRLRPDLFLGDGHADLWRAVGELERHKLSAAPDTLRQLSGGRVEAEYIARLMNAHPAAPPNLAHHVAMLEWDHARVTAVRGPVASMLDSLRDPASPPDRVRALARQVSVAFDGFGDRRYLRDTATLVDEQMRAIEERARVQACWPYGIADLDADAATSQWRMVPGAAPGQVTVVTGVPGSGKSTVTANIVLAQARRKRRVLYGAWEMGDGVTLELLAAMSIGLSRYRLTTGSLTDDELVLLRDRMTRIGEWVRFVQMPFGRVVGEKQSNERNLDIVHGYIADSGCDVAVFDLWKRCLRYTDPDDEEQALVRQQAIAQETRCHCILVQQQRSKDIEQRADKRPTREGIKGSGAWVEIADTILGVHRPALWKNLPDDILEIGVLKQRYGRWPLAVEFDWIPDCGSLAKGRAIDWDAPDVADESRLDIKIKGGGNGGKRKK